MGVLAGLLVVLGSIAAGYRLENGNWQVLLQPSEMLIIFGGALGALLIANPRSTIRAIGLGLRRILRKSEYSREFYLSTLTLLSELFVYGQIKGLNKLEGVIDAPEEYDIFKRHPAFLQKPFLVSYLCDTLRLFIFARPDPFDLNQMLDEDAESFQRDRREPSKGLAALADALPGLGIVAAVLGVILTMGVIGGPKTLVGEKVAASLVGTFVGILCSYGIIGPMAARMERANQEEAQCCELLRVGVSAYTRGCSPRVSVEFARRAIATRVRPSFQDIDRRRPA